MKRSIFLFLSICAARLFAQDKSATVDSSNKVKGGGQECPPYAGR